MHWHFGPFRLDLANAWLWHADQAVALRPKTFELLVYLVTHAGQLVTKEALLDALWPETAVGDGVLKTSMTELRKALGETAKAPQWIATVHRRGYRFVAPVTPGEVAPPPAVLPAPAPTRAMPPAAGPAPPPVPRLVAREAEVAALHQWFAGALQGKRHLGFMTGEAGIGKTTLVDTFVAQLAGQAPLWLGRGQCIEQYGAGEAYLPLLAALGQMGRSPDGPHLVALLRQHAPSWLLQLPALLSPQDAETLQRYAGGTTRERMLRELVEAMEVLTAARPCLLVLEDLHWSDTATIEWLAYMARRRGPARLLVLGTYRPAEALVRAHPVHTMVQELTMHGYGAELPIVAWSEAGVAAYLAQRGGGAAVPAMLARVLTARTDGNPLFLVAVVDELVRQGRLQAGPAGWEWGGGLDAVTGAVPPSIRHLLEHQVARLCSTDQELLAAASVVGVEFEVAAVAAGLQQAEEDVEARCDTLAHQHHLVQARGTAVWPNGTVTARYGFRHALYQELLYEQVPVSRRTRLHQQIGMRLEAAYATQAAALAVELAEHFVRGRDTHRAVKYLQQAAENAARRYAQHEVIRALTQALKLLPLLPDARERAQQERTMQLTLGSAFVATQGAGAADVERAYARARELGQQGGGTAQRGLAVLGLAWTFLVRGQAVTARELAGQALEHFRALHDTVGLARAHALLGSALSLLGVLEAGRGHLEQSLALSRTQPSFRGSTGPEDLEVFCRARLAETLWLLGYPAQALQGSQEALRLAGDLSSPSSQAMALTFAARLHQYRREAHQAYTQAEAALELAREHQLALRQAQARVLRGWAFVMQGQEETGMTQLHQGLAAVRATGEGVEQLHRLALLVEAYGHARQPAAGLQTLEEVLVLSHTSGEHRWEAELYRLKGELLLAQGGAGPKRQEGEGAEACFQQALATARHQGAKSLELRTAMSLARLWQQQGQRAEAHALLAPIYGWFTEGFDTADLQEAQALLDELVG